MESAENGARLLVYGKTIDDDIEVHTRYTDDIRVHASDVWLTYECMRVTYG